MTLDLKAPGVYVEEDQTLSLSITSGSTSIPVFVFNPLKASASTAALIPEAGVLKKFDGWLDYLKFFNGIMNIDDPDNKISMTVATDFGKKTGDVAKTADDIFTQEDIKGIKYSHDPSADFSSYIKTLQARQSALGYYDIQHYFQNGGGACYGYFYSMAADVENVVAKSFTQLPALITGCPAISLIVLSGNAQVNKLAYTAINPLLSQSLAHTTPLFCLTGGGITSTDSYPKDTPAQTAAYYPFLKTPYQQRFIPEASKIQIEKYIHYYLDKPAVTTFSDTVPVPTHSPGSESEGSESGDTPQPMSELDWEIKMSNAEKALAELASSRNRVPGPDEPPFDEQAFALKMSDAEKALAELADQKPQLLDVASPPSVATPHDKRLSDAAKFQAELAVVGKIISDSAKTVEHQKDAVEAAETLKKLQKMAQELPQDEIEAPTQTDATKTGYEDPKKGSKEEGKGSADVAKSKVKTKPINDLAALKDVNPALAGTLLDLIQKQTSPVWLSPVAAIAGAYCLTDSQRGVWKAPANVVLSAVADLCDESGKSVAVTDAVNAELIKNGVNPVRYFPGKGYTVWGARTRVDENSTDWRYIPVRRLFNMAERDIKEAMATAVFEPNSPPTWEILRSAVDVYLHSLWQQGALFGNKPDEAYFVKIGLGTTMTTTDINQGRLIIKVGMAAVKPAEFIILEFSQKQL